MVKEVDLLSYWMPVLRHLKEFKEIAKVEEPEIKQLLEACSDTINNLFIPTANEYGISHFEKMLNIFPSDGEDIETRRLTVLTAWSSKEVYTERWLHDKLASMFGGSEKVGIIPQYDKYSVEIDVETGVRGAVEIISSLLSDTLPCNLRYILNTYMIEQKTSPLTAGITVSTAMHYQITNDIKGEVSIMSDLNNAAVNSTATLITLKSETDTTALVGEAILGTMIVGTT